LVDNSSSFFIPKIPGHLIKNSGNLVASKAQPTIEIVAGQNGSGKTMFAESYFLRTKRNRMSSPPVLARSISRKHRYKPQGTRIIQSLSSTSLSR
jgi:hypothetical protein